VAPLAELIELAFPLLREGGVLVAWKRGDVDDPSGLGAELPAARRALGKIDPGGRIGVDVALTGRAAPEALADHRLIVVERGTGQIGATWPRDPATRRRQPW
jgi:hypothetical protein